MPRTSPSIVDPVISVPLFLAGSPVLMHAMVDRRHGPTGSAAGFMRGEPFLPTALAICGDAGGGFYLFGCDAEWNTVTDTWHQTVEDAMEQAEFEYPGIGERWIRG
jgi:hypothetical protein